MSRHFLFPSALTPVGREKEIKRRLLKKFRKVSKKRKHLLTLLFEKWNKKWMNKLSVLETLTSGKIPKSYELEGYVQQRRWAEATLPRLSIERETICLPWSAFLRSLPHECKWISFHDRFQSLFVFMLHIVYLGFHLINNTINMLKIVMQNPERKYWFFSNRRLQHRPQTHYLIK